MLEEHLVVLYTEHALSFFTLEQARKIDIISLHFIDKGNETQTSVYS